MRKFWNNHNHRTTVIVIATGATYACTTFVEKMLFPWILKLGYILMFKS